MLLPRRRPALRTVLFCAVSLLPPACSEGSHPSSSLGNPEASVETDASGDSAQPAPGTDAAATDSPGETAAAIDARGPDADASMGGDSPAGDATIVDVVSGPPDVEAGPLAAPQCDPSHVWAPVGPLPSVPTTNFARFGGISRDELTIAWTLTDGTINVADRVAHDGGGPHRTDPFGAPSVVSPGTITLALDRVALSPDGSRLFAVTMDRLHFVEFSRTGLGAPWAQSTTQEFMNVDAMASLDGSLFYEPVYALDGSFYFLLSSPGAPKVLYESTLASGVWTMGVAFTDTNLMNTAAITHRATGASQDGRTLFFFDQGDAGGVERAGWRMGSSFTQFVTLGPIANDAGEITFAEAAPNVRCDTLYFQATGSGGTGIYVAQ